MTALNPLYTIGNQIGEVLELHEGLDHEPGARSRDRAAGAHRHSRPGQEGRCLPAPAVRRPAAARDDRDGARVPAQAPDCRRADDGAGRDDPGADPGAARRPAARVRDGDPVHHARPEPGAALHPPRRRDGEAAGWSSRAPTAEVFARPRASLHDQADRRAGRERAVEPVPADAPILAAARDVSVDFVSAKGWFGKDVFRAVRDTTLELKRGRDARHRRRIRVGQDDARHGAARAAADRRRRDHVRGHAPGRRRPHDAARDAPPDAGRVPGPVRVAVAADDDRADRGRGRRAAHARAVEGGSAASGSSRCWPRSACRRRTASSTC